MLAVEACGYSRDEVLDRPFWDTPWWRGSDDVKAAHPLRGRAGCGGRGLPRNVAILGGGRQRARRRVRDASDRGRSGRGAISFTRRVSTSQTGSRPKRLFERSKLRNGRSRSGFSEHSFPRGSSIVPEIALAALYEAGSDVLEVGGDWYDAFELPDGRIALTVGDVVGHGLAAAAAMGQVRTALAALADHAAGPAELLERLDGFLARSRTTDFATVCYAVLDPAHRRSGVRVRRPSSDARRLTSRRDGLGSIRPNRLRSAATASRSTPGINSASNQGPLLVLYSDGLVERRNERFDDSLTPLAAAVRAAADLPVEEVCSTLMATLGVDSSRDDDVAVMAVRLEADANALSPPVSGARRRASPAPRFHARLARRTSNRTTSAARRSSSRSARHAQTLSSTPTATRSTATFRST